MPGTFGLLRLPENTGRFLGGAASIDLPHGRSAMILRAFARYICGARYYLFSSAGIRVLAYSLFSGVNSGEFDFRQRSIGNDLLALFKAGKSGCLVGLMYV